MMQCEKQLHQDRDYFDLRNGAAGNPPFVQSLPANSPAFDILVHKGT
jgi:hypothetical protein